MLSLAGGLYLGWALGANDASNVFGTAVGTRIIQFRYATILCAAAVILGAILQGQAGIETYSELTRQSSHTLILVTFSAAITVTLMTFLSLPISTSQAVVGAITGIGLATGTMNYAALTKVIICWVSAPIGAMLIAAVLYPLVGLFFRHLPMSLLTRDKILWLGLILVGTYGAYALGANNVANATGILSGQFPGLDDRDLTLLGGVAIAIGVMTFSRRVMMAVGTGLFQLEAHTAFVAVASMSLAVHVLAMIGVPVSTSQAIIGAILGVSLWRGMENVRWSLLRNIGVGWLLTPAVSLILASAGFAIFLNRG
jgi:inorganic phosphate transporter, PiT family